MLGTSNGNRCRLIFDDKMLVLVFTQDGPTEESFPSIFARVLTSESDVKLKILKAAALEEIRRSLPEKHQDVFHLNEASREIKVYRTFRESKDDRLMIEEVSNPDPMKMLPLIAALVKRFTCIDPSNLRSQLNITLSSECKLKLSNTQDYLKYF